MASLHGTAPASAEQLAEELKHPHASTIWNRAVEIFGDEAKARSWMKTPRDLFDGLAPEELIETGDPVQQRRVLEILIRIDYGVFS
jgi:putative toxin-antitoxin system antitoxin component (TIGR02293 family)